MNSCLQVSKLVSKYHYIINREPEIKKIIGNFRSIVCNNNSEELFYKYVHTKKYVSNENLLRCQNKVISNNYVNFQKTKWFGFDYDYTIACYKRNSLNQYIYTQGLEYLIEKLNYPAELRNYEYNDEFSIRGLSIDLTNGYVLKLSQQNVVVVVYDGLDKLNNHEIRKIYNNRFMPVWYKEKNLRPLNDLFTYVVSSLAVNIFNHYKAHDIHPLQRKHIINDILAANDWVHISGTMHKEVIRNPSKFLTKDPELPLLFEHIKKHGKETFLITNSNFEFVDAGMKYIMGEKWIDLFKIVVVSAKKPYFYESKDLPFREVDPKTGELLKKPIQKLEEGKVYSGGCLKYLSEYSEIGNEQVIYFGDSIYADLYAAKRQYNWKTVAVVSELDDEVNRMLSKEYQSAYFVYKLSDITLRMIQSHLNDKGKIDKDWYIVLNELEKMIQKFSAEKHQIVNQFFGSILKAQHNKSIFGYSLQRHCDLFTADIRNLLRYSLDYRFYPEENFNIDLDYYFTNLCELIEAKCANGNGHSHNNGDGIYRNEDENYVNIQNDSHTPNGIYERTKRL